MTTPSPAAIRTILVPSEHGGWSLTLEPAILGLIVAPTPAGFALAAAALVGFLFRTPARVVLVDRFRDRHLERTALALRVAAIEAAILIILVITAAVTADHAWWPPLIPAALLISVELWYDIRSRSRRLVPELAGTIGISAIAAAIALAGGAETSIAYSLWLVMAVRAASAVFFVRLQLRRAKGQAHRVRDSDAAQGAAAAAVVLGATVGSVPLAGAAAVAVLGVAHVVLSRTPPPRAAMVGAQQVVFGLIIVVITGLAAIAP